MQSLFNLKKSSLTTVTIAGCTACVVSNHSRLALFALSLFVALGLASVVSSARAATTHTDPSFFSGSETIVDFEGNGPPDTVLPTIDGIGFSLSGGFGVTLCQLDDAELRPFGPAGNCYVDTVVSSTPTFFDRSMTIDFGTTIHRVSFVSRSNEPDDLNLSFQIMAGGTVIDTAVFSVPGSTDWTFSGFETVAFDELVIDANAFTNGYFRIDNLRFEVVPEPSTIALLALGLGGLAWRGRASRAQVSTKPTHGGLWASPPMAIECPHEVRTLRNQLRPLRQP